MLVIILSFSRCSLQGSLDADRGGRQQVFGTRRKWDSKGWEHTPVSSLLLIQASSLLLGEETLTLLSNPKARAGTATAGLRLQQGRLHPHGDTSEQAVFM